MNRVLIILVAGVLVLGMAGIAGAATFSDVTGTDVQASAIYKLNSLGVISGYPDGTFGPEKTITRAEFAKIAVYLAGQQQVADGMSNTPSAFSDVPADHWANGWINVAAAQGFVKGGPDGTFRPAEEITQAEVVTVLMRILGYNDNLPGNWPANYIAKAANLGVLDDLPFIASQAATRGAAAVMGSAVLDEYMVNYLSSDNIFESTDETLLAAKFDDASAIEDAVTYDVDLSNGKVAVSFGWYSDNASGKEVWKTGKYALAEDCVVANGVPWTQFIPRMVDFVVNDDDEVTYLKVLDYGNLFMSSDDLEILARNVEIDAAGNVTSAQATRISVDDKSYDCDDNWMSLNPYYWYLKNDSGDITATLNQTLEKSLADNGAAVDLYSVILNKDGDIQAISSEAWATGSISGIVDMGIVEKVNLDNKKITFKNGGSVQLDKDDPDGYYVVYDVAPGTLADIQPNDLVWVYSNAHNVDKLVYVYSAKNFSLSGTMDSYEDGENLPVPSGALKSVTVDGKEYDVAIAGIFLYSDDEGENFDVMGVGDADTMDEVVGKEVTVWTTPVANKVFAVANAAAGNTSVIYGVINDVATSLVNGELVTSVEVMKADGTTATYAPDDNSDLAYNGTTYEDFDPDSYIGTDAAKYPLHPDAFVSLTLNADGYIDVIKAGSSIKGYKAFANQAISGDKDEDTITIDGNSYDTSKAVIFNTSLTEAKDDDEVDTVPLDDFMDAADDGISACNSYASIIGNEVRYWVLDNMNVLGSNNKLAVVAGRGINSDGAYVKLITTGEAVKYTVKSADVVYAKGDVVLYDIVSGKVKIKNMGSTGTSPLNWKVAGEQMTISKISGNIITLKNLAGKTANYAVDSDTRYFDYTEDDPVAVEKSDLAAGDIVLVYQEDTGAIGAIELVDAD
ncbi:MAG TPA: S-layer homology domain-containing protein [Syntrophomonas sp.]|nr:S-layer homology domain-containing protein [Syntrophomonas sp.]